MTNPLRLSELDEVRFDVRELARLVESKLDLAIDSERARRLSTARSSSNTNSSAESDLDSWTIRIDLWKTLGGHHEGSDSSILLARLVLPSVYPQWNTRRTWSSQHEEEPP
jgi:hypothetical protein